MNLKERSAEKNPCKGRKVKIKLNYTRVCLILVVLYFCVTFVKQQLKINEYNIEIDSINATIENVKQDIVETNNKLDVASTDEYKESVARSRLGLIKSYEKVFVDINK